MFPFRRKTAPAAEPLLDGPSWDDDQAAELLGSLCLAGITWLAPDGSEEGRTQFYGRVIAVDRDKGVTIACQGYWEGRRSTLPPHIGAYRPAKPGKYQLHSTGEIVEDPDFVTTWRLQAPTQ